MEPLTMLIVGAVYAARAIDAEIRANKARKTSLSYSSSPSSSSTSVSQPEIKKAPDTRMCQPEIKLSDNNKMKAE